MEILETSANRRTRNPEAYVVTLSARKAGAGLRAPRSEAGGLDRDNAARALQEVWIFPVAPETCNLACTHCLYAASPGTRNPYRLSSEELENVLAQVSALGAKPHFLFSGGEPTLHPGLFDFLETVDRRGYSLQLMTNGTRIGRENAERLSRLSHLLKVQISLESADPRSNDAIMGPGIHRRVLAAAETLRNKGVEVSLAATPMAGNGEGLPALEDLAREQGTGLILISLFDLGAARANGLTAAAREEQEAAGEAPGLMCDRGVSYSEGAFYPCPVLVKEPGARLGDTLEEAVSAEARRRVGRLRAVHAACQVCLRGNT